MKSPAQMTANQVRATGRHLSRTCTNLIHSIERAQTQFSPLIFDFPALRGVIESLGKTAEVLGRFHRSADVARRRERDALSGDTPHPARESETRLVDIANVFAEALNSRSEPGSGAQGVAPADLAPTACAIRSNAPEQIVEFPPGMFRLPDILQLLAAHGKTGVVRVHLGTETIVIHIVDGDLTAAQSLGGPLEMRLGQLLAKKGLITEDQLEIVLKANKKSDRKLGRLLREWIDLDEEAVALALRDQLKLLFQRALGQPEARVNFVPADIIDQEPEADEIRLNMMGILLESLAESEGPRQDRDAD